MKTPETALRSGMVLYLVVCLMVWAVSCCSKKGEQPPDSQKEKYNVILLSVDTLRADRLGSYGYKARSSSPHFDALADDGILFENFVTTSPWTVPAHMSMLTSLYPSSHGLMSSFKEMWSGLFGEQQNFFKLPEDRITLAEVLRDSGFSTVAFTAGGPLDAKLGFGQGFDNYDTSMYKLNDKNMESLFEWISRNKQKQFFLFWHHFEVHAPYLHADFIEDVIKGPLSDIIHQKMNYLAELPFQKLWPGSEAKLLDMQYNQLKKLKAYNRDVCEALYVGGVLAADLWFGRLVEFLKSQDLYETTLIVFTSDHGEEFGDHNPEFFFNMHGYNVYEEMVRVPLVIKLPKQYAAGTRISSLAQTVDIMPTILDILGITPVRNDMQGVSLVPFWTKGKTLSPKVAYIEALAALYEMKGLRTNRYKYIVYVDAKMVKEYSRSYLPKDSFSLELYDLEHDPSEKNNLVQSDLNPNIMQLVTDFDRLLRQHLAEQSGYVEPIELDTATIEKLRELGYLGVESRETSQKVEP